MNKADTLWTILVSAGMISENSKLELKQARGVFAFMK